MSNILTLMKYELDSNGRYLEDTGTIIESSFISEDLLKALIERVPPAKLTIFEELGSDESSDAICLQNDKIQEALDFIKNEFILLLKASKISTIENSNERLLEAISALRMITNLYSILEIKFEKYKSDDTVVIKLG